MSTNWSQLRKELKELKKEVDIKRISLKRKGGMPGEANKWKKAKQEIENASKGEENSNSPTITKILALDCEYVGVGIGGVDNMLARVSIVNVDGETVYDEYVIPTEKITDYRVEVSGIRPGHLKRGIPFTQVQTEVRKILSDNIVVGHSIHNDFQVLGLTHPPKLIRDTAKCKLLRETLDEPKRTPSLKLLAHHLLGVQIQQGEHDSVMDAKIALRIYLQHQNKWEKTKPGKTKKKKKKKVKKKIFIFKIILLFFIFIFVKIIKNYI
ncbi:Exonuclease domain-containing protein [Meloidogyne graminicola]|uniref:RNA exonuclease 4 n=1 Tax=Meloidogyne graminicola TaxID=189291 RepID=A0A8T0A393_9BILA|nr:Exonuclease domain-containing protein [Meloidogyne graminicola]